MHNLDLIADAMGHACLWFEIAGVALVVLILCLTSKHEQDRDVIWTDEDVVTLDEFFEDFQKGATK